MSRENGKLKKNWSRHIVSAAIFVVFVIADQLSKFYIVKNLFLGQFEELIPGMLNITYSQNPGGAFSLLAEHPNAFLIVSSIAIIVLIVIYFRMAKDLSTGIFATMILSGAIGNLIDRLRIGHVIDFIDFYVGDWHWYIFNVADAAITVGAIGLIIVVIIAEVKSMKTEKAAPPTGEDTNAEIEEIAE